MENIRESIQSLADRGNVTYEEFEQLRMNSWEQELLYPAMTDDCLIRVIEEHILPNCGGKYRSNRPATTYEEALQCVFVPAILERLKKKLSMAKLVPAELEISPGKEHETALISWTFECGMVVRFVCAWKEVEKNLEDFMKQMEARPDSAPQSKEL